MKTITVSDAYADQVPGKMYTSHRGGEIREIRHAGGDWYIIEVHIPSREQATNNLPSTVTRQVRGDKKLYYHE